MVHLLPGTVAPVDIQGAGSALSSLVAERGGGDRGHLALLEGEEHLLLELGVELARGAGSVTGKVTGTVSGKAR